MLPRILLILSVVLIIAAGVLSFQTKTQIVKILADLSQTRQTLATTQDILGKTTKSLEETRKNLLEKTQLADSLTEERNRLTADLSKANADLEDNKSKLAAANAKIAELNEQIPQNGNALEQAKTRIAELETKVKEDETKIGELDTVVQTLTAKNNEQENKIGVMQKAEDQRQRRIMAKELTGRVVAVNRAYNFLVLDVGDKKGVVMNGEMVVKRGDSEIARVKITSVEPATSIADIVPGTLGRGLTVQAGDQVIYPGPSL